MVSTPTPHGDRPPALHRLLVGYDGSDAAAAASAFALWLAGKTGAQASLVHVSPDLAHAAHTASAEALMAAAEQRLNEHLEWRHRLDEAAGWLRSAREHAGDEVAVVEEIVEGHAREQLVAACERHGPAVLAVGSRGLGQFAGTPAQPSLAAGSSAARSAACGGRAWSPARP